MSNNEGRMIDTQYSRDIECIEKRTSETSDW